MSNAEQPPQARLPVDAVAGTPAWPDTASVGPDYGWSRYAWRYLDREQARELWGELTDWVGWLRARYQLGHTIPPCWYRHAVMVEELTALMAAHHAAYTTSSDGHDPPRDTLAAWHRHWHWPLVDRFPALSNTSRCSDTGCGHTARNPVTLDGLPEFLAADLDTRPEPALPQPKRYRQGSTAGRLHPVPSGPPTAHVDSQRTGQHRPDAMCLSAAAMAEHRAAGDAVDLPDAHGRPRVRLHDHVWVRSQTAGGWLRQPDGEDSPA
ncbi:hypothetical protein [Aldersonia kunmingensis]|uniref:hypothetical protein n=1 Tax=Aldersonia kunmingensis TaxID=408066 RepID=UPI000831B2C9|nr:hypothetical protein [Aldersonia kunmingensis]